jgi:hypothetical protein
MIEFCKYLSVKGCTLHYNIQNSTRKLKGRINYYAPPPLLAAASASVAPVTKILTSTF